MNNIIYGIHPIESLLETKPSRVKLVYILKNCKNNRIISLIKKIQFNKIKIKITNKKWMNQQTQYKTHQGIFAIITPNTYYADNDIENFTKNKNPFLLILDCITDPHNLGSCLRTANAAGVHAVIIPKNKSAKLNSIAKKVACGAAEYTPLIMVTNLTRTIIKLKNTCNIIGAVINSSKSLYDTQLTGPIALIIGSEQKGIRNLIQKQCDYLINIPTSGHINTLNTSVATAICLFEVVRQRNINYK